MGEEERLLKGDRIGFGSQERGIERKQDVLKRVFKG